MYYYKKKLNTIQYHTLLRHERITNGYNILPVFNRVLDVSISVVCTLKHKFTNNEFSLI